jgi:hypothetical protein
MDASLVRAITLGAALSLGCDRGGGGVGPPQPSRDSAVADLADTTPTNTLPPQDGPQPEAPTPTGDGAAGDSADAMDAADAPDGSDATGDWPRPALVDVPRLTPIPWSTLPLPRSDAGALVLFQAPRARLLLDPTREGPMQGYGRCAQLLVNCLRSGASVDACAVSVPSCATVRPWEEAGGCCPVACRNAYERARRAGTAPPVALREVYGRRPACYPGLRELLAVRP